MINILETRSATIFHANPELVSAQIGAEISHNVGMPAIFHHEDFLLDDSKIVTRLQLDDFDGGKLFRIAIVATITTGIVAIGWQNSPGFVDIAISSGSDSLKI